MSDLSISAVLLLATFALIGVVAAVSRRKPESDGATCVDCGRDTDDGTELCGQCYRALLQSGDH